MKGKTKEMLMWIVLTIVLTSTTVMIVMKHRPTHVEICHGEKIETIKVYSTPSDDNFNIGHTFSGNIGLEVSDGVYMTSEGLELGY